MLTIFLGEPGSGKGTISDILVDKHGFKHISTGNIFREQISNQTELGLKVKSIIESGNLVDDATTWEIAKVALKSFDLVNDKVILDGFPRNIEQALIMEAWMKEEGLEDAIPVLFDVPADVILARLTGRRMCKVCGKAYHMVFMPPKVDGVCDIDGGELFQREDDKIENVQVRLDVYKSTTQPLVDLYKERGTVRIVNGNSPELSTIANDTLEVLK